MRLSIKSFFILLTLFSVMMTIALAIALSIKSKNDLVTSESQRYFQQSVNNAQTVFDFKVDAIFSSINLIHFDSDTVAAIRQKDSGAIKQTLKTVTPPDFDFSTFISMDKKQVVTQGVFLHPIEPFKQQLLSINTATPQKKLIHFVDGQESIVYIVASRGVIDPDSGEVLGFLVGGVALNSAFKLVNSIKEGSQLDKVLLEYGGKTVVSYGEKIDLSHLHRYNRVVFDDDNLITFQSQLDFNGEYSGLSVKMALQSKSLETVQQLMIKDFIIIALFATVMILVFLYFIHKILIQPIERLKLYAKGFVVGQNRQKKELDIGVKEYQELANYLYGLFAKLLYNQKKLQEAKEKIDNDLKVIEELNATLETKVAQKTQELQDQIQQMKQKDQLLQEQAKLASMGEMIDAIAHQWKTPLTTISLYAQSIELHLDEGVDKKEVMQDVNGILDNVEHLVETINSFREFLRPVSVIQPTSIHGLIQSSLLLMKDELTKHNIAVEVTGEDMEIFLIPNEFKHVLINLFSNSKDAFEQNDIAYKTISCNIQKLSQYSAKLQITDTAGGIPSSAIEHIFEPNFTTKEDVGGTGIGLYMSKLILDKIGADIEVYNTESGACFEITVYNACSLIQKV